MICVLELASFIYAYRTLICFFVEQYTMNFDLFVRVQILVVFTERL